MDDDLNEPDFDGTCPVCGYVAEVASPVVEEGRALTLGAGNSIRPNPGDVSICIACATICIFTEESALRIATPVHDAWVFEGEAVTMSLAIRKARENAFAKGDYWPTGPGA